MTPAQRTDSGAEPVLIARLGLERYVFPLGVQVRVGRDPELELVSTNPLVTRSLHGVITSDTGGAWYTDHSRRGTFLDGKKLRRPLRISSSVVLRLGDPATGEELGITPPLPAERIERNLRGRARANRRRGLIGSALLLLTGVGIWFAVPRHAPAGSADTLSRSALTRAEAGTVRILQGTPGSATGSGSGTLISPDGLILTNAHVAQPRAPGHAVAVGVPGAALPADPANLTVEVGTHPPAPVTARYLARPVAVDGYLDFAVLQVFADINGQTISPSSLKLPYVDVGDVAGLRLAQQVTVLGYPAISESDSITVTNGVISAFVPDPLKHSPDPRFQLETTARVAHGNSGGAAIDNSGRLIGVPSLSVTGQGSDVSWRLRSVGLAGALIKAARAHTPYGATLLTQPGPDQRVTSAGVGATPVQACSGTPMLGGEPSEVFFGVTYANLPPGLDIALLVTGPAGQRLTTPGGRLPSQGRATSPDGCLTVQLSASDLGVRAIPPGGYRLQLLGGPNFDPIGSPAAVVLGGFAAGGGSGQTTGHT